MSESNIISSYLNDSNTYSLLINDILQFLSNSNHNVYIFGGFLRECISRQNINKINNYLLNDNGDIDIIINNFSKIHVFKFLLSVKNKYHILNIKQTDGNYTENLETKIINTYKNKGLNVQSIQQMMNQLKCIATHYKYTINFTNKKSINIDFLITPNISNFISSNLDLSINSLYFNYTNSELLSKSEKLIPYNTIIKHIQNKQFIIINTKRFIPIIYRIFKIMNSRKYYPIYENTYTYNYMFTRILKLLKHKSTLKNSLSQENKQYIYNNLNSKLLYNVVSYYNNTCNVCNCVLGTPSIICAKCTHQYYEHNSQILNPVNLNSNIIFKFTIYSINEYHSELFTELNQIYPNYIYTKLNYQTRLNVFNYIAKNNSNKTVNYFKYCNFNKHIKYYDICIIAYNCIIYSNYILLKHLLTLININDIPYNNNENILEFSFHFNCINICNLISNYKYRIAKSSNLLYKLCMSNNLKMVKLYLNSCDVINHTNFNSQFINNLIKCTNSNNVIYLRDRFKFKFSANNIIQLITKNKMKISNNYITFIPKLNNILSNCSDSIDIYPANHWNYNPIPKYLLNNYMIEYILLCDYNISINKLLVYINIMICNKNSSQFKNKITTLLISYYYLKNVDLINMISTYV